MHQVIEEVDGGQTVVQMRVDVAPGETAQTLKSKVQALALSDYLLRRDRRAAIEEEAERAAKAAMERAVLEEEKKQEKERRLEISRRKAAEARAAIKPKSVVRFVPKVPPPRPRPPPVEEAA